VDGIAAADSTVFRHDGRWWLLCIDVDRSDDTLCAWHATSLRGPWLPHAANPLKTDTRNTRPAGTPFVHAGKLYRPAQDNSRTYGGRVVINEIVRLSPSEFAERVVRVIPPFHSSPYPAGFHTLSAFGDWTLIDGKRIRVAWPHLGWRLRARVLRTLGTGAAPGPEDAVAESRQATPMARSRRDTSIQPRL
jgi:hypothetical protein